MEAGEADGKDDARILVDSGRRGAVHDVQVLALGDQRQVVRVRDRCHLHHRAPRFVRALPMTVVNVRITSTQINRQQQQNTEVESILSTKLVRLDSVFQKWKRQLVPAVHKQLWPSDRRNLFVSLFLFFCCCRGGNWIRKRADESRLCVYGFCAVCYYIHLQQQ